MVYHDSIIAQKGAQSQGIHELKAGCRVLTDFLLLKNSYQKSFSENAHYFYSETCP